MTGCELGLGKTFDLGICARSVLLAWVPDWVWVALPYLPWLLLVIVAAGIWRVAGTPGLVSFAGLVGYVLGRRHATHEPVETDLSPRDRVPAPKKPKPILADTSIFEDFMTRLRKKK